MLKINKFIIILSLHLKINIYNKSGNLKIPNTNNNEHITIKITNKYLINR